jgi:hypothetical protein
LDKLKPSGKLRFAARSRRQQGDNSRSAPIRRRSLPFIFIAFRFGSTQLTARISSSRGRINLHLAAYRVIAVSRIAKANGLQSAENVTDPNVRIPPAALINGEKRLIAQSVAMEVSRLRRSSAFLLVKDRGSSLSYNLLGVKLL